MSFRGEGEEEKGQLTALLLREDQQKCQSLGVSDVWPRTLRIHNEAGALRIEVIERLEDRRSDAAAVIVTGSVSKARSDASEAPRAEDANVSASSPAASRKVKEGQEPRQPDTSIAATRSRRKAASTPYMNSPKEVATPSATKPEVVEEEQDSDEEQQYVVMIEGLPKVYNSKSEYKSSLKAANLWRQHLQELARVGDLQESAIKLAFGEPKTTSEGGRDRQTPAQAELAALLKSTEAAHDALQQPVTQQDSVASELMPLYDEIEEPSNKDTADQIMGFVRRRLTGKRIFQVDRRETYLKALWDIKMEQKKLARGPKQRKAQEEIEEVSMLVAGAI